MIYFTRIIEYLSRIQRTIYLATYKHMQKMNRANIFQFRNFSALLLNFLVTALEYSIEHYSFAVDTVPSMNTDAMPHSAEV
jgi:hypothetical protein